MYLVSRNIVYRTTMPQSPSKQAPWDLTQFSQSPSAALSYFPESHRWPEISLLPKIILVLGKGRSPRVPNLGCRGPESKEWFDVSPKNCMRWDTWASALLWWSCQSPVSHSCGLLNYWNSFHGGMVKLNAKSDADSLLHLLCHFEWDGHTVHMLTQQYLPPPLTSAVKSSLFTHAHFRPLSLAASLHPCCANCSHYINNGWTLSGQTFYITKSTDTWRRKIISGS